MVLVERIVLDLFAAAVGAAAEMNGFVLAMVVAAAASAEMEVVAKIYLKLGPL